MAHSDLWAAVSMLALTGCGGTPPPPAEPAPQSRTASDAPSSDSVATSTPHDDGPTDTVSAEEAQDQWAKHAKGEGADPFRGDVVGFKLGMDEAQLRKVCAKAKGELLEGASLQCRFDKVLPKVFKGTALWLNEPRRGWADGNISFQLNDAGTLCGISVGLSGSDLGSVVPPSDLLGKVGMPQKLSDVREARVARWRWPGGEHESFGGWAHHLPSYEGPVGRRKWVSYCRRSVMECRAFCSFLE